MNTEHILARGREWARRVKQDIVALWIAAGDPRTPWRAKAAAALVAGYALSPIDLIPDFIPVLGYLDDAILLPLGVMLAIRLIPGRLMDEFRVEAGRRVERPVSRRGMVVVIAIWLAAFGCALW
ncbi:Protein of unknown function [Rubrimonas cliftonensis]|uniref:DUF1232 domain-containing protein n=1 Tax=Rubrimonas cliftonensis TaxID=89524 RepID=A0A1H4G204_9RHOB|nr:Protein of unknown function [Rubrimonas cliftonensis]